MQKKSPSYVHKIIMYKGRGIPRGTTFIPLDKFGATFIDSALSGFSDYPMITEEAGLSLTQEPPHQAHPSILGTEGLESMVL